MFPSINSLRNKFKEKNASHIEGLFNQPNKPKRSIHAKASLMDEIFSNKKTIYPSPPFPKFYTYNESKGKDVKKRMPSIL